MTQFVHACYRIGEIDRSLRFYKALGLEERARRSGKEGETVIFMGPPGEVAPYLLLTFQEGVHDYTLGTGYSHIMLQVDDMEQTLERLDGIDVQPHQAPYRLGGPGSRVVCPLRDPDGYWVILIADDGEPGVDPALDGMAEQEAARRETAIDSSTNQVLPASAEIGAEGVEALWLEEFPEYPRVRHDGHSSLQVRLRPERGIEAWIRHGRRRKPALDRKSGEWTLPYAWRDDIIRRLADRYGGVIVFRDAAEVERCAPACVKAESPVTECECSCGGVNHGTGSLPAGFHVINEALAVRVSPVHEVKVTFVTPRGDAELARLGLV